MALHFHFDVNSQHRIHSTFGQVLSEYGYDTAAFGKWHNTPIDNLFKSGPFDQYPTGPLVDDGMLCCFLIQWIGLRENLQETIDFPIKSGAFLKLFPYTNPLIDGLNQWGNLFFCVTFCPKKGWRVEVPDNTRVIVWLMG